MKYFNYDMQRKIPKDMKDILEKYFGGSDFMVSNVLYNREGDVDTITIDTTPYVFDGVKNIVKGEWVHYAHLFKVAEGWQLAESFIYIGYGFVEEWGEEYRKWIDTGQTATNIYGTFKTFRGAVRNLSIKGTSANDRKAKEVYV